MVSVGTIPNCGRPRVWIPGKRRHHYTVPRSIVWYSSRYQIHTGSSRDGSFLLEITFLVAFRRSNPSKRLHNVLTTDSSDLYPSLSKPEPHRSLCCRHVLFRCLPDDQLGHGLIWTLGLYISQNSPHHIKLGTASIFTDIGKSRLRHVRPNACRKTVTMDAQMLRVGNGFDSARDCVIHLPVTAAGAKDQIRSGPKND